VSAHSSRRALSLQRERGGGAAGRRGGLVERRCGLLEWPRTLLPLIDVLHEHSSLQQVARTVLLAEDDDEGGLLGLTCATRAGLSSGCGAAAMGSRPGQGRTQARCKRLSLAADQL
jgi:hypothetical protein